MTPPHAVAQALQQELVTAARREISGIAAIDAAIPHASPDYVVMFHDARMAKQANVEQMATLVRMQGETPDERGSARRMLAHVQGTIMSRSAGPWRSYPCGAPRSSSLRCIRTPPATRTAS